MQRLLGIGWVCENHPQRAWAKELGCQCGAGMPCECLRAEVGFGLMRVHHYQPEPCRLANVIGAWEKQEMSNRYLVRRGGKGWMVYDRERKGPALLGVDLASNLTREQAEQVELILIAGEERQGR
jgi:hypothetical protein